MESFLNRQVCLLMHFFLSWFSERNNSITQTFFGPITNELREVDVSMILPERQEVTKNIKRRFQCTVPTYKRAKRKLVFLFHTWVQGFLETGTSQVNKQLFHEPALTKRWPVNTRREA